MASAPVKVALFVAGALVAAGGTAYFAGMFDLYLEEEGREIAELPEEGLPESERAERGDRLTSGEDEAEIETSREEAESDEASGEDGEAESRDDDGDAAASSGEDRADEGENRQASGEAAERDEAGETGEDEGRGIVVPSFDIVRVEPDGSLVIAGSAEPESQVEILDGADVLATATAGATGEFVAVLDEPLAPGNYQLVLRAASEDSTVTSEETAIVAVPDDESGEVLALVEQPGEPSRLITVPEGAPVGDEVARVEDAETIAVADDDDDDGQDDADRAASQDDGEPRDGDEGASSIDVAGADLLEGGESSGGGPEGGDDVRDGEAAGETTRAEDDDADDRDRAQHSAPADESGEAAQTATRLFIEAVEIDGDEVFVAGTASAGSHIRAYANDVLLGDSVASPGGRFLVEASRELPVGDYIVRADVLSDDGATVVARAAVPFRRDAGEQIAAVAPQVSDAVGDTGGDAAAGDEAGREDASQDDSRPRASADGREGRKGDAESRDDEGGAASSTADGAGDDADRRAAPADDLSEMETGGDEPDSSGRAGGAGEADEDEAGATSGEELGNGAGDEQIASAGDSAAAMPDDGRVGEVDATTAPQLESVDGAVIIRRGDTLWHISRRVYGRGVRYTTIYLANEQQIRDPDWIWPGQVFALPGETEEGVAADLEALGEQSVPAPEDGASAQ